MRRTIRILAFGCVAVALAACSHKDKNAPLAYVPADTPYLVANLKPLTNDARDALMQASMTTPMRAKQVASLRYVADDLAREHKDGLSRLVRAFADSIDGKTYVQIATDTGIDPSGLFAVYGLGLSPVMRGRLSDPDKFHAYVAKLEKAYGHAFAKGTLDKVDYQHVTLGQSGLQAIIATHDKQFVVAVLPTQVDTGELRLALGLDHPQHSIQGSGRLEKLADANGYGPYSVGYIDTTMLPALIAGGNDPMLKALLSAGSGKLTTQWAGKMPASCKGDLARIAARMPLVSTGYTTLKPKNRVQQIDIELAPDIVKAFQGVGKAVPGLGGNAPSKALADVAFALPIPKIRDFWLAQADAVKDKPFTCPALVSLNGLAATAARYLPRLSMPPLGQLRGLRLVVDQYAPGDHGQATTFRGRLLIASHNPAGLRDMAKAMVPALGQIKLSDNGKPVALPDQSTARFKINQPTWAAMDKQALAIGIGQGEKKSLPGMLHASAGPENALSRSRIDGQLYLAWLSRVYQHMDDTMAKSAAAHPLDARIRKQRARAQADLAAMQAAFKHIDTISTRASLTDKGIRITADSRLK